MVTMDGWFARRGGDGRLSPKKKKKNDSESDVTGRTKVADLYGEDAGRKVSCDWIPWIPPCFHKLSENPTGRCNQKIRGFQKETPPMRQRVRKFRFQKFYFFLLGSC